MGGRRRQAWAMRTKVLPSTSSASGTAKRRQIWRKISGVADDRSRHGGCDGDHRLVDGSARASSGRPGRSGQGLAYASDEISWALPAIADAVPRKRQDLPRDADVHIRTRLLEGLWTHGSGHLLRAFLRALWERDFTAIGTVGSRKASRSSRGVHSVPTFRRGACRLLGESKARQRPAEMLAGSPAPPCCQCL